MKVAFISCILGYPWGGPDRLWTEAALRMQERGDEVFVGISPLTADHEKVKELQRTGASIFLRHENSIFRGRRKELQRRTPVLREGYLETQLAKFSPDLVILTQGGTFDFTAEHYLMDWLLSSRTPYVLVCHQAQEAPTLNQEAQVSMTKVFSQAARTAFVSTANRMTAEHTMRLVIPRASVIQNPIAWTAKGALPWMGDLAGPADLFALGRIDLWQKGWDIFLAAAGRVAKEFDFVIRLAGHGADAALIREYAAYYGVALRLEIQEFLPPEDIHNFWCRGELFLLPSRSEGCASTMLEAMMCGRPLLATRVGGVDDWLQDGENAFLAGATSVELVEEALRRALTNRKHWREMGLSARATFDARRDNDPVGTFVRILDSVVTE